MFTAPVQTRVPIDDLAAELLPSSLRNAIGSVTLERWRHVRISDRRGRAAVATQPAQRTLPVVVFGETVFQPLVFPDPLVVQVAEGKSYRAIRDAISRDGEVLLVFVAQSELAGYRSSVPQDLPTVGVVARVHEEGDRSAAPHRIRIEAASRASVIARLAHAPFYQAACVPLPDPTAAGAAAERLMRQVKQQVTALARRSGPQHALYGAAFVERMLAFVDEIQEPGRLADACAAGPMFSYAERLALLQTLDPLERLTAVHRKLGG